MVGRPAQERLRVGASCRRDRSVARVPADTCRLPEWPCPALSYSLLAIPRSPKNDPKSEKPTAILITDQRITRGQIKRLDRRIGCQREFAGQPPGGSGWRHIPIMVQLEFGKWPAHCRSCPLHYHSSDEAGSANCANSSHTARGPNPLIRQTGKLPDLTRAGTQYFLPAVGSESQWTVHRSRSLPHQSNSATPCNDPVETCSGVIVTRRAQ